MSPSPPNPHIQTYIWEVLLDGRIAIVQHGGQYHILVACDTVNTLGEAAQRVAELERKFQEQAAQSEQGREETDASTPSGAGVS